MKPTRCTACGGHADNARAPSSVTRAVYDCQSCNGRGFTGLPKTIAGLRALLLETEPGSQLRIAALSVLYEYGLDASDELTAIAKQQGHDPLASSSVVSQFVKNR